MHRKTNLIVGAICGALCVSSVLAYGAEVQSSFERERAEVLERYGGEQVEVCVATKDIEVGDVLGSANTETRLWLGELLPEGAVFSIEDMQGKPASSPIFKGEVVTQQRFEKSEHVALQVPDGLCAVSVPAKSVSAVGGSVEAGSYVDVYATSSAATDLIASSVLVLSTSSTEEQEKSGEEDIAWVTLAIEPDLVKEVIAAAQKSELYFVLPSGEETVDEESGEDVLASGTADSEGMEDMQKETGGEEGDMPEEAPLAADANEGYGGTASEEAGGVSSSDAIRGSEKSNVNSNATGNVPSRTA